MKFPDDCEKKESNNIACQNYKVWNDIAGGNSKSANGAPDLTPAIEESLASWQLSYPRTFDAGLTTNCDLVWNFSSMADFAYKCVYAPDDFAGVLSH